MGESSGRVSVNLMQNYKSPRVAVTIRAILVIIHTHTTQHRQTDRQTYGQLPTGYTVL